MAKPKYMGSIRGDKWKQGKQQATGETQPAATVQHQPAQSTMPCPVVRLEPRAPLIVRSGRPFYD